MSEPPISYDMAEEWSLFVHRERTEIERRLGDLGEQGNVVGLPKRNPHDC